MCRWHEGEASRGSQEVGCCLLHYVQELPQCVKHIEAFSDSAGGQNMNKKVLKLWPYTVNSTQIRTVDHRFLISRHSFTECDQDFGAIKKSKKKSQHFFVPDDWTKIVAKVSRKFTIIWMGIDNFVSLRPMSDILTLSRVYVSCSGFTFKRINHTNSFTRML
jgi:hypothetical protein